MVWVILISAEDLSIRTRVRRSSMILLSRSISSDISPMNSWYSSLGTSSMLMRESARTRMEVIGVFNSWDTLDTNSCLDWSTAFRLCRVLLMAREICLVSR